MNDDMWDSPSSYEELENQEDLYEEEEDESIYEEDSFDLDEIEEFEEEEDEGQNLINNARIRLEQGRLYEMLIQHSLFDDPEAIPEAVAKVEKEVKTFITERLEILLGMKAEKETEIQQIIQEPQFNDLEVKVLKMIAEKATKGASALAPTTAPASGTSVVKKEQNKSKLNTIGAKKKVNKIAPARKEPVKNQPTPLANKKRVRKKIKKEFADTSTKNMNEVQVAKKDMKYIDSLKNKSLEEANAIVSQRHNRPRPRKEINQDLINSHYQQKVSMDNTRGNDYAKILKHAALQNAQKKSEE